MNTYTSYSELPLVLGAEDVSHLLGISRAGAYTLFHREDFPCVKINKRMLVERDKLLAWLDTQSQGEIKGATAE